MWCFKDLLWVESGTGAVTQSGDLSKHLSLQDRARTVDQIHVCLYLSKGNRVNILEPGHRDRSLGAKCGNANEPGDLGGSCVY